MTSCKNNRVFSSQGNIDAYTLNIVQWCFELNEGRFIAWLTLFLPEEAVWKESIGVEKWTEKQF